MRITKYNIEVGKDCKAVLVKENSRNCTAVDNLNSPQKVKTALDEVFRASYQAEEHVYLIALTTKCKPIGVFDVFHGSAQTCLMNTREIFVRLCICGAVSFIVAHNHPSDDCMPSADDIRSTSKLASAANMMSIPLLDHIIISPKEMFSFKEHNMLPEQ